MKIAVYCSSSKTLDQKYFDCGTRFGQLMVERGHSLVYGGYDEGIMGTVAKAIVEGKGELIGVIPEIFHSPEFTYDQCSKIIYTDTMSQRKAVMENEADALAVLPGGIGTFDEMFEAYVLITLKELSKPIAVYNAYGCYDILIDFLKKNVEEGFLSEENYNMLKFFSDPLEMIQYFEKNK